MREDFYDDTRSFFGRRYKLHLSPRVIVAHPITENSSFFFNYGEFTQIPSYRYVYSKLTSISSESFPLLGNPESQPAGLGELRGRRQAPVPAHGGGQPDVLREGRLRLPDARRPFKRSQGASLVDIFVYLNGHFSRSKGFEIEVEKRRSNYWSGKLIYTFQQTKGKSSDPNEQKAVQEIGGNAAETRLSETFVSWNRPHKLTLSFDLRFDDAAPTASAGSGSPGSTSTCRASRGAPTRPTNLAD